MKIKDINGNINSYNKNEFGITVSAYGLAIKEKRLLLIKEKVSRKMSLPGGEINFEELKREFKEETTLEIISAKIINAGTDFFDHPTLGPVKSYLLFYSVTLKDYKLRDISESDVSWVRWVPFAMLDLKQIHSIFHPIIRREIIKKEKVME